MKDLKPIIISRNDGPNRIEAIECNTGIFEVRIFFNGRIVSKTILTDNQIRNLAVLAGFLEADE